MYVCGGEGRLVMCMCMWGGRGGSRYRGGSGHSPSYAAVYVGRLVMYVWGGRGGGKVPVCGGLDTLLCYAWGGAERQR